MCWGLPRVRRAGRRGYTTFAERLRPGPMPNPRSTRLLQPPMPPGAPEGRPPMWNTYIAVDDVDATVDKVGPAGGQVLMAPVDIGEAGRMAFVADPTGPAVGLWQANRHIGATLVGEPGAPLR